MLRLTNKIYSPNSNAQHHYDSWVRVVYCLYQSGGEATYYQLARVLNHRPPLSGQRKRQMDTNLGFIKYCVRRGWLEEFDG